jgi:pyridoxine kinase
MRDAAVPLADIVTPNVFELSWLTGMSADGITDAISAARRLRATGPRTVVVTGIPDAAGGIATLCLHEAGVDLVTTPRVDVAVNGTGDSFAALFLARLLTTRDIAASLAHAASAVYALLERTAAAGARELLLVEAQDVLVSPIPAFAARRIA